jgi:hypothetical protein
MLEWPVLVLFELAVVAFLMRAARGAESATAAEDSGRWLGNRRLNLLGLAYLPLLVLDVATTGRVQMLRPILHLALFAVAAKLWSLREEKQKWQTWLGPSSSSSPRWRPASIPRSSSTSSSTSC